MPRSSPADPAARFRQLHVEESGARAIATTSAGIAWALGYPDGQRIPRKEMLRQVALIVRAVRVPVTADMERGYGTGTPADAAETARGVIAAGAVGLNLEDAPGGSSARTTRSGSTRRCAVPACTSTPALTGSSSRSLRPT